MRIDDATMLMFRVATIGWRRSGGEFRRIAERPPAPDEARQERNQSALGWNQSASKDLKSVSEQVAEQADHTSEQVIKGLRGLRTGP